MSLRSERLSAFYALRAAEEPDADPEARLRFRRVFAAAGLRPGERVLDIGAKWGGFGLFARDRGIGISYTGLELSEAHIERAAALGVDVRRADVTDPLPVDAGTYDCVVCLELLEHLPEALDLLAEIRRVLTDDGRALLTVPNPYNWVEVYRELRRLPDPEGHLNGFTTPVMENLLGLAGLRIDRRLGTSVRIPRTTRLVPTNSILARSRIYVVRPTRHVLFAGRRL